MLSYKSPLVVYRPFITTTYRSFILNAICVCLPNYRYNNNDDIGRTPFQESTKNTVLAIRRGLYLNWSFFIPQILVD